MTNNNAPSGCLATALGLYLVAAIAWVGFLIWAIYSIVTWLTHK